MHMPSVLVVDDEEPVRAVVSRLLAHDGYRVSTAGSGREAIQKLRTDRFDVLLLDLRLPEESELDTMTEIRGCDPDLPIIVMSGELGLDDGSSTSGVEHRGARACLAKPFSFEELREAVSKALA
jgi:CheY-like chemotaxis protein